MNWEERPYQQEAIAACLAAFVQRGKSSVMLESPVGSGKTYMGLETIHLLQEVLGRKLRVNWVAPRRHLLKQVMEANRDLHGDIIRPVSLFEKTPPPADLVVLDEAHHEATQSCVLLYEKMKPEYVLGLSATPLRTDRMKLSFLETVSTCAIDRLIREGYLSPFHSYLLPNYGPEIAAECYLASPERWGKTLAFFKTVLECVQFQKNLAAGGVRCEVVTGESDKDRQLEEFIAGRVPVIANVSMLTEGFDQADVRTVFIRDASRLPTIQMGGRGLRRCEGKTHCNIVQSSKTSFLFERVSPAQRRFRLMNGQWMALQGGTAAIEETLKQSLALLEAREKARKARRERERTFDGSSGGASRDFDGDAFSGVNPLVLENYKFFYALYELCNRLGWNGMLPPCKLCFNYSARPSRVAGFVVPANPNLVLCLNLSIVAKSNTASLLPVLLHEMTHIWQLAKGQRGGHGVGFYRELRRVGIDEHRQMSIPGSAAEQAMYESETRYPQAAANWRTMVGNPPHHQHLIEQRIFEEYLKVREKRNQHA